MEITCKKLKVIATKNTTYHCLPQEFTFHSKIKNKIYDNRIRLYQSRLAIEITSNEVVPCNNLWNICLDILRFFMIFKGYFFHISKISFSDSQASKSELISQNKNCRETLLFYYESLEYLDHQFDFRINLDDRFEQVFNKWIDIESKWGINHKVYLIALGNSKMPQDLRFGLLLQCFEPLFDYLNKTAQLTISPTNKEYRNSFSDYINQLISSDTSDIWNKTNKGEFQKFLTESIKKHFFDRFSLKEKLHEIINIFGKELFFKEMSEDPQLAELLKKFINTRNRIFHIIDNQKNFLNGCECAGYGMKLSILYRRILLDILGIDFNSYSSKYNSLIDSIDEWIKREC